MIKGSLHFSNGKYFVYAAVLLSIAGLISYSTLHYTLLTDPMPLTMREPAPILMSEAYAEGLKDGVFLPYGMEQYPQATSVYGPIYTVLTGALHFVSGGEPYLLHRGFVGFAILASALICGLVIAKFANWYSGLLAAVWLYLSLLTDSTAAAGPSALAVLFYILGIASILQFGTGRRGLALGILAGFLGLLTKPYAVLIIPAILTYTYLFHSPRRAIGAAILTGAVSCLLFLLIGYLMPTYFHSVFQIHSAYATRFLDHLLSQSFLFSKLNFGLLAVFFATLPLPRLLLRRRLLTCFWGNEPLLSPDIGFDKFLALAAGAVLLLSLGWHGGAYLIYFNHLLLPALLIAAFRGIQGGGIRFTILRAVVLLNMALLVLDFPPQREESSAHLAVMSHLRNKRVLVDPVLDPLARLFDTVDVIDNGQAEYLINYDMRFGGEFAGRSREWSDELASKITSGDYEGIYLSSVYYRELLLSRGSSSVLLSRYYERVHVARIPIYFSRFKDRRYLGKGIAEVFYFKRRDQGGGDISG